MILEVKNINKSFDEKIVLNNISFSLETGRIVGLVGRNGAGKTTLLKILSRIIEPDSGTCSLDVKDYFDYPELIEHIAYLPDRFDYFSYNTCQKAMDYYEILYPKFNRDFVVSEANKLGLPLNKNIKTLSKGNKTILGLLIVLATGSEFLLIDETLDGLDVLNREIIMKYLLDASDEGRCVLISTHQLTELQGIADEVYYISLNGEIEGVDKKKDVPFCKLQVVVKESMPNDLLKESIERFRVGRVYTLLIEGKEEDVIKKMVREEIVQFDVLPLQIEDKFYFEKGREDKDERL